MRLVTVALRTRWLWLGAAVLVAALGGAATWVANRNYPGMRFIEYRMAQPLDTPTAIAAAPGLRGPAKAAGDEIGLGRFGTARRRLRLA